MQILDKKHFRTLLWLAAALLAAGVAYFTLVKNWRNHSAHKVAFIGFNDKQAHCADCLQVADTIKLMYLQGAMNRMNPRFAVKPFYCDKQNPEDIRRIYAQIAADTSISLVVDNTWGRHLLLSRDSILTNAIPVISLEADRNIELAADLGGNVVFLQPSDNWPKYISKFVHNVLNADSVGFVSEQDYRLDQTFRNAFSKDSIRANDLGLNLSQQVTKQTNKEQVRMLEKVRDFKGEVLVFNTHAHNSNLFADSSKLRKWLHPNVRYVLGLNISQESIKKLAKRVPNVQFLRLIIGEEMLPHDLLLQYRRYTQRHRDLQKNDPNFRDHFRNIAEASNLISGMMNDHSLVQTICGSKGDACVRGTRAYFRKALQQGADLKVFGNRQFFRFDANQILVKTATFQYFKGHDEGINPYQINNAGQKIPNLHVVVGQVELKDIDVRNNLFNCNLKYWVVVPTAFDTLNQKTGYVNFNLARTNETNIDLISTTRDNDLSLSIYEVNGALFHKFVTREYPFDTQSIYLPISALGPSEKIRISFDASRINHQAAWINSELQVNGWRWADVDSMHTFASLDNYYVPEYGSLLPVAADNHNREEEYRTLGIWLQVARVRWGAILMIVLPLLIFGVLPAVMLMVKDEKVRRLRDQIINVILTVVVFGYNLIQISPDTEGITRASAMMAWTFLSSMACLIFAIVTGKEPAPSKAVPRWERYFRRYFPVVWLWVFLWVFLLLIPNGWGVYFRF